MFEVGHLACGHGRENLQGGCQRSMGGMNQHDQLTGRFHDGPD